jgi:mono/diheme cytochrome c family protein
MLRTCLWLLALCGLCGISATVLANIRKPQSHDTDGIKTTQHRESELDLEITGDLPGVASKTVLFIPRAELLKLPQVVYTVNDDANFAGKTEVSGVPLSALALALSANSAGTMIVAICVDGYQAYYTAEYVRVHQPILVLRVDGKDPPQWPTNPEVHGASMAPYLISHPKFTPSFKVLAHQDEAQIPWGVVRLEFRDEKNLLAAIAPRGKHATDTSVLNGFLIARQNCLRCHDNDGVGGKKAGRSWQVLALWAQASPARFAKYVRNPQAVNAKSQMAASPQYDDATIQALTDYFKAFLPDGKK